MKKILTSKLLMLPSLIAMVFSQAAIHPAQAACAGANALTCTGISNTVSGKTILLSGGGEGTGIAADSMGSNNTLLTIVDTTINNQKTASPSIGINFGTPGTAGSGDLSLVMVGSNSVTTRAGTAILVNNLGIGDANILISGAIQVINNSSNASDQDGVEATSRRGNAQVDMSGATGTILVKGGNGVLIDSLGNDGAIIFGNVIGDIGSGVAITMDNTNNGNRINSGIKAVTEADGTVFLSTAATIGTLGPNARGILASTRRGAIAVDNSGSITTEGASSYGIDANSTVGGASAAGDVRLINSGDIKTSAATGISASSSATAVGPTGNVELTNSGNITTGGDASHGIEALAKSTGTGAAGNVLVTTTGGEISTSGNSGSGIKAVSSAANNISTGTVTVNNAGAITTGGANDSVGIYAESTGTGGNVTVTSTGADIMTTGTGSNNEGIKAFAFKAASSVTFENGTISVGGDSAGVLASGDIIAEVILNSGAINAVATQNRGAIEALASNSTNGASRVILDSASEVHGGSGSGVAISGLAQTLNNAGTIDALSDVAIVGDSNATYAGSAFTLTNTGTITGTVAATRAATTIDNSGTWNLRNFADTDGDGQRDAWGVAVSSLGTSASNVINNTGMLTLMQQDAAPTTFVATGAYLPQGNAFNTPASGGPVQGQILNVQTFNNSGTIDLTGGGNDAGNVLVISGADQPGVNGGGVFVSNGGTVIMNTVLNEGGANSQSDVLVVDSTQVGSGATGLKVNQVGGEGAYTQDNGILLVEVLDKNASATGAFAQAGRIVGGAFEYSLYQGGLGADAADGNWYLRSDLIPESPPSQPELPPSQPESPPSPPESPLPRPEYRPEVGAYLGNQIAAMGMFRHTLHDRLGEVDYLERLRGTNGKRHKAGWARVVGHHTGTQAADGQLDLNTNMGLAQVGLELGDWTNGDSRWLVGVMAGAGTAHTDSLSSKYRAEGDVDGYSLGVYGTWYQSARDARGLYLDSWVQHGWYRNKVKGEQLAAERYNSRAWSASLEAGYAFEVKRDSEKAIYIEPQAQVIYTDYAAKAHREANGTLVRPEKVGGFISRLGARVYTRPVLMDKQRVQPFFEANWWHSYDANSMTFNGYSLSQDMPRNTYEFKLGAEAEVGKGWAMWGHVGTRLGAGSEDFHDLSALVGAKYSW